MDPITGVVGKKVTESAWAYFRGWFTRNQDLEKQIQILQAQLAEERSGRLAFEKLMSELECRPEDENIYWRKDGNGGPYCPLCLHDNAKLIPMTHGRQGAFYCRLHDHYFETQGLRDRDRQAARNRAQASQRRSRFGPHSWMGS